MFEIEKFDGSNDFRLWKIKMKALLVLHGLEGAIDGERSSVLALINPEGSKTIMSKALSMIQLSLSDEVLREVCDLDSAPAVWEKLDTLYRKKPLENRLYLKSRLYQLRMSPDTSIADHVNLFDRIMRDLRNIEVNISDEDQALRLLCSLPKSLRICVEDMLYPRTSITPTTSITLEDVKSVLNSIDQSSKDQPPPLM